MQCWTGVNWFVEEHERRLSICRMIVVTVENCFPLERLACLRDLGYAAGGKAREDEYDDDRLNPHAA